MKQTPILMCGEMVIATLDDRKDQTRRIITPQPPDWAEQAEYSCTGWGPDRNHRWCFNDDGCFDAWTTNCRHGDPGDRLWVKETFCPQTNMFGQEFNDRTPFYRATGDTLPTHHHWKPSIFMPRWASRITLYITTTRAQRLQDISEEDAKAEGIRSFTKDDKLHKYWPCDPCEGDLKCAWVNLPRTAKEAFRVLWNSINLTPKPLYETVDEKKQIVSYESFPWSAEDFDAKYPGVRESGVYRGKPITVVPNPWVWAITFKRLDTKD